MARRVPERRDVPSRPVLGKRLPDLVRRLRTLLDEQPPRRSHLLDVQPLEIARERRIAELAHRDRLQQRPDGEAVTGRHEVDRRPVEHHDADGAALGQELAQLIRPESIDASPEADIRIHRLLGLHPDQPLHRVEGCHRLAAQEHLSRQDRPVELAAGEGARRHASGCHTARSWPKATR